MHANPVLAPTIATDPQLWRNFLAICDCGGRLAGTESERRAFSLINGIAEAATGVTARSIPVPYGGWSVLRASLTLPSGTTAPCQPLVRSVATPAAGMVAEVIDLGRGTPEEFEAHRQEIRGRIVMVRHE